MILNYIDFKTHVLRLNLNNIMLKLGLTIITGKRFHSSGTATEKE